MKRERKEKDEHDPESGESFSDGGEEFKARRLCNRSADRAMEQAVSHPLKRRREKQIAKPFAEKKEWLRNDNRGFGGQRRRGWRDLRYKSGVEPPQSK